MMTLKRLNDRGWSNLRHDGTNYMVLYGTAERAGEIAGVAEVKDGTGCAKIVSCLEDGWDALRLALERTEFLNFRAAAASYGF